MRRQELPQNRLPAKREVKLDIFMKISAQTGHIQFVARLEIKTTINKHDNEISNKKNGCLFLYPSWVSASWFSHASSPDVLLHRVIRS